MTHKNKKKPLKSKKSPIQLFYEAQFHGANRLSDKESRWFWVPAMLILLALAVILIILTINRFQDNPIYMIHIEDVSKNKKFPSILLCPEILFTEEKMDLFLSEIKYPDNVTAADIRPILQQLAAFYALDVPYDLLDLMRIEQLLDFNNIDVETAGRRLTTSCEESFIRCRWNRIDVKCSDIFKMEFSGVGFCCVFNGRSLKREMEELRRSHTKHVPNRSLYTGQFGYTNGLMMAVNQPQNHANVDLSYKWIAIQHQHFVDTPVNGTPLNPGTEHWITYDSTKFGIGYGAQALASSLKRCKMSTESLYYFPMYNRKYCRLELEMANVLKRCRCVRTVHPRPDGTTRCRAHMLLCAQQALGLYSDKDVECPRTCDVEYEYLKESMFTLNNAVVPIDPFYAGLDYKKVSVIRVFIQNQRQRIRKRWATFSHVDLFSQIGGMFSVFFGCSVLTFLGLLQVAWRVLTIQWQRLRTLRNE